MNLIVMKFGGTSVGNIDNINNVANIVEKESISNKIIVARKSDTKSIVGYAIFTNQVKEDERLDN